MYECVTGTGSIEIVNGIEKLTGLTSIISKYDEEKPSTSSASRL